MLENIINIKNEFNVNENMNIPNSNLTNTDKPNYMYDSKQDLQKYDKFNNKQNNTLFQLLNKYTNNISFENESENEQFENGVIKSKSCDYYTFHDKNLNKDDIDKKSTILQIIHLQIES